ncbi:hypothetical protein MSPP1_000376 [Malassezia sp. CBS 17886]|nr:hypothetical protein MSPP1_000376 [Malassezia sp. CBS 17886]
MRASGWAVVRGARTPGTGGRVRTPQVRAASSYVIHEGHAPRAAAADAPRAADVPATRLTDLLERTANTAPERMWHLYCDALSERGAVHDAPVDARGRRRLPMALSLVQHRQVLHALARPSEAHTESVRRRERLRRARADARDAPVPRTEALDLSSPAARGDRSRARVALSAAEASVFLQRVRTIFMHMRAVSPESVTAADYSQALAVLAQDGHHAEMLALWDEMVAARDGAGTDTAALTFTHRAPITTAAPDRTTYHHMMYGLFRQFQEQTRALQTAHGHALLPTQSARTRARAAAVRGAPADADNARRHVAAAAQQAARHAAQLLEDMQQHSLQPSATTLDLAARILRVTGQFAALLTLLRSGFGVDLEHPDAPRGTPATAPCRPTTHTLNTALMALGDHAAVPDMVVAFETITQPLDADRAARANSTTYALLVKHACSAPDTLFLAGALLPQRRPLLARLAAAPPTVGLATAADRTHEVSQRTAGAYQQIACYVLDDALREADKHVTDMRAHLHVAPPAPGADTHAVLARAAPVFLPPSVSVTAELVYPLVALASRRRRTTLFAWLATRLDTACRVKKDELAAVDEKAAQLAESPSERALQASLTAHRERVREELDRLLWLRLDRVRTRTSALMARNQERNARRRERRPADSRGGAKGRRARRGMREQATEG